MKQQLSKIFGIHDRMDQEEVKHIKLSDIVPSPYQPRTIFDDERIEELSQTIKTHGVIQPIIVRVRDNKFEIIAGERRYRAACKLNMETIPAIVREFNDSQAASIALIENLQREGLTSIEEATAYQQLMEIHQLTQESLAQRIGKSQSTIANKIRLLQLTQEVKDALMQRKITERHARALLALTDEKLQVSMLHEIIEKELNVRQTEMRIQALKEPKPKERSRRVSFTKDVRLAVNTIRQSIHMVRTSGMNIETDEQDQGDYYEITIKIPKNKIS